MSILSTLRPVRTEPGRPSVDLAFPIAGDYLPRDYPFALDAALLGVLPWLADEADAGIHPMRAPLTDRGFVLSRRTRLVLRIPADRTAAARLLSGRRFAVGDANVEVGIPSERPIEAFPTLRALFVASSADDEQGFVEDVKMQLAVLGVSAQIICGKPQSLVAGGRRLAGFALALHDLSPPHSLLLQTRGLGAARRLGCGVFVHHKIIEGLDAAPE